MEKSHQWPQYLAVFAASFLTIGTGIQLGWPSPSVPKLLSRDLGFDTSEDEVSYIVMISPLGYLIGSPMSGFFLDRIGRKYTLLMLAPIQIVTWFTIAFSDRALTLYCARVLMGVTESGMFTALPAYIGEVMEPQVRGRAGTSVSLGLLVGTLLINIYGSFVSIRTAAYISLSTPIIFLVTFTFMPESPYYYMAKGAEGNARRSLKALRRVSNVENELAQIKKAVQRQLAEPGRLQDIFVVRSNLKAFVILAVLRTVQQFSGLYVIGFYMQVIFKNANSSLPPHISAIICNVVRIFTTFASSLFIDHYGRRVMIFWSGLGTALTLVVTGVYFNLLRLGYDLDYIKWLPLTVIILYNIFCSMGLLVVPTLMMGELLPSNIKAQALTLMNIYFGLCMSASSKLFQWTDTSFGTHIPFYIFAVVCLFGIVFTYALVPETKGKSLEEIQHILKGTKPIRESKILLEQR